MWGNNTVSSLDFILLQINKQNIKNLVGAASSRVFTMADLLAASGLVGDGVPLFDLLSAADRIASAAMWLVVHETYAQNVYLDGMDLTLEDFKPHPEGHTGGAFNMVPAYVGYMAINAITGFPRSWIMGLGRS